MVCPFGSCTTSGREPVGDLQRQRRARGLFGADVVQAAPMNCWLSPFRWALCELRSEEGGVEAMGTEPHCYK